MTHEQLFGRPTSDFPTLELPVAKFSNPEDAVLYDGASAWASVLLRIAMTTDRQKLQGLRQLPWMQEEDTPVHTLFMHSNLWLGVEITACDDSSVGGSLNLSANEVCLTANGRSLQCAEEIRWVHRPPYGNVISHVRTEDPTLFTFEDCRYPLAVEEQRYRDQPGNRDYQQNPGLRIARVFGEAAMAVELPRFRNLPDDATQVSVSIAKRYNV